MSKGKNKGGTYNGLSYSVCYGLTEDMKMDYSIPIYEFNKYCECETCRKRLMADRLPSNSLTVSTDDKRDFPKIKKMIDDYTCGESDYIGYKFISMRNGTIEEKIL